MFDMFGNGMFQQASAPDAQTAKDVENVVNQYAGKSQNELLSTLQSMVAGERAAGRLDAARMETIKNTLLPMMDEAQRKRMEEVLRLLQ